MKATNLLQLSKELRASLINEFNLKDFSVKLDVFSIHVNIGDNFQKRKVTNFIKGKDLRLLLENGKTKKFKYIFVLKKTKLKNKVN